MPKQKTSSLSKLSMTALKEYVAAKKKILSRSEKNKASHVHDLIDHQLASRVIKHLENKKPLDTVNLSEWREQIIKNLAKKLTTLGIQDHDSLIKRGVPERLKTILKNLNTAPLETQGQASSDASISAFQSIGTQTSLGEKQDLGTQTLKNAPLGKDLGTQTSDSAKQAPLTQDSGTQTSNDASLRQNVRPQLSDTAGWLSHKQRIAFYAILHRLEKYASSENSYLSIERGTNDEIVYETKALGNLRNTHFVNSVINRTLARRLYKALDDCKDEVTFQNLTSTEAIQDMRKAIIEEYKCKERDPKNEYTKSLQSNSFTQGSVKQFERFVDPGLSSPTLTRILADLPAVLQVTPLEKVQYALQTYIKNATKRQEHTFFSGSKARRDVNMALAMELLHKIASPNESELGNLFHGVEKRHQALHQEMKLSRSDYWGITSEELKKVIKLAQSLFPVKSSEPPLKDTPKM